MSNINVSDLTNKLPISDMKLAESVDNAMIRLEAYYPEHQIFAFDAIDKYLREQIVAFSKKIGYVSVEDMLDAYGYKIISGSEVKRLRNHVIYKPGQEPDFIRPKIESMLRRLSEYYPDNIIRNGLQNEHKKLSSSISGLYQWLGYPDSKSMLEAYGYQYIKREAGRPESNHDEVIEILLEKYKTTLKVHSISELTNDNPELKGKIKTLQNRALELYGKTLKKYFEEIGILAPREREERHKVVHEVRVERTLDDYNQIVDSLVEKYKTEKRPYTLRELCEENPDYELELHSLKYMAPRLYNKQLKKYFIEIGILGEKELEIKRKEPKVPKIKKKAPRLYEPLPDVQSTLDDVISDDEEPVMLLDISSFQKVDREKYKIRNVFRCNSEYADYCESRFRGYDEDIEKLRKYLSKGNYHEEPYEYGDMPSWNRNFMVYKLGDGFSEMRVFHENAPDLVKEFPSLKVLSLCENRDMSRVYALFSDSGYAVYSKCEDVGLYDPRAEDGDSRWAMIYDMFNMPRRRFVYMQTGDEIRLNSRSTIPEEIATLWSKSDFLLERDGEFYFDPSVPKTTFTPAQGTFKLHLAADKTINIWKYTMEDVKLPEGLWCIIGYANPATKRINIPDSVRMIDRGAFHDRTDIEGLRIPRKLEKVGRRAFCKCAIPSEIEIPESTILLEEGAFSENAQLNTVVIKATDVYIEKAAFAKCINLSEVYFTGEFTGYLGEDIFDKSPNVKIYGMPGSMVERYAKQNYIPFIDIRTVEMK